MEQINILVVDDEKEIADLEDSYSMGYNDCLLDILMEKEEVSAPIMFPTLKS